MAYPPSSKTSGDSKAHKRGSGPKPLIVNEPTPDVRHDGKVKLWVAILGLVGALAGVAATTYVATRPPTGKGTVSAQSVAPPVTVSTAVTSSPQINIFNNTSAQPPTLSSSSKPAISPPPSMSLAELHQCLPAAFPFTQLPVSQMKQVLQQPDVMHAALLDAAEKGKTTCVRGFIAAGVSPNSDEATTSGKVTGVTPLIAAIQGKHLATVRALLEDGADANLAGLARVGNGTTPLMQAVAFLPSAVPLLLAKNVDVNYQGDKGITALYRAAIQGDTATVKALLEHGADRNIQHLGSTAPT